MTVSLAKWKPYLSLIVPVLAAYLLLCGLAGAGNATVSAKATDVQQPGGRIPLTTTFLVNQTFDATDFNPGDGVCSSNAEPGSCTLRAAIMEANALPGADAIILPAGIFSLTLSGDDDTGLAGDLDISGTLTITGSGPELTVVDASGLFYFDRVFDILPNTGPVVLSGMTIRGGNTFSVGGGIRHQGTDLLLVDSTVTGNDSQIPEQPQGGGAGGGIYGGTGSLTVLTSTIAGNYAGSTGGGIYIYGGQLALNGSTLTANDAVDAGGAIYLGGGQITLDDTQVVTNSADYGGGIYIDYDGAFTQTSGLVNDNRANVVGGGIYASFGGTVALLGGQVAGNTADEGGGVYVNGEVLLAGNAEIVDNYAVNGSGGGVLGFYGDFIQTGGTVGYNTALYDGGGVALNGGLFDLQAGAIISNTADSEGTGDGVGGGVYLSYGKGQQPGKGPLQTRPTRYRQTAGTISYNEAYRGGGIFVDFGVDLFADNAEVSHNRAADGAGIYLWNSATAEFGPDLTIEQNDAGLSGGGVYLQSNALVASSARITGNSASSGDGGGLYVESGAIVTQTAGLIGDNDVAETYGGGLYVAGQAVLSGTQVTGNYAGSGGGGLYADGIVTITAALIGENQTFYSGGGIYNSGTLSIADSTIASNTTTYGGGGGLYNEYSGGVIITGTTLSGNASGDNGGGILNWGTQWLTNTTISGNGTTGSGGGIYESAALSTYLVNVTITDNTADTDQDGFGDGGGLVNDYGHVEALNSIIAGNVDDSPDARYPDCFNNAGSFSNIAYNLVGNSLGCSDDFVNGINGNLVGSNTFPLDPYLGPLQDNGGPTATHALLQGSPAINAGSDSGCPATDQRGLPRFVYGACDIGAFEVQDLLQSGPVFVVNTPADPGDGVCGLDECTLREAITAANEHANVKVDDVIDFDIPVEAGQTIRPLTALPAIGERVVIDGLTQSGASCDTWPPVLPVELDGSLAVAGDGLTIDSTGATVRGLAIHSFAGSGIGLSAAFGSLLECNLIYGNQGDGVLVTSGTGNAILSNGIYSNTNLGIDLGGDGVTPNDVGDGDSGANNLQNYPVLTAAVPQAQTTVVQGRLNSSGGMTYTLQFFANSACDPSEYGEGQALLGTITTTTDITGDVAFSTTLPVVVPLNQFVTATATDESGNTSEFSQCVVAGPNNVTWPQALRLTPLNPDRPPLPLQTVAVEQYLDKTGTSRWYKFHIEPGSRVTVTLTNLPANYDLTLFKDILAAYQSFNPPQDLQELAQLTAEFAPDVFSPDVFSPDVFSPDVFSPDMYSPDVFSPDVFSPDVFSPDVFSPDVFSPDVYSPDVYSPDVFSPDVYSPDVFSPDVYSPDVYSPDPSAYASAQIRSVIAASGFDGTTSEGIVINTWDNTGDFYVRVRGRNGAFSLAQPFRLAVTVVSDICNGVSTSLPPTSLSAQANNYQTIILTDRARLYASDPLSVTVQQKLLDLAARPEVNGVVVDVSQDARVAAANAQADAFPACPYAKNLVAYAVKDLVDAYRVLNPLAYVVLVGDDDVIPFFRYPDQASLANEKNYVPPVRDNTASQASLRLGYILSQDHYGAQTVVSLRVNSFPLPDLAVGRLVENLSDIIGMLDAYSSTAGGVVPAPASALVTGYDFLTDDALAVKDELAAGLGTPVDTLIAPADVSPQDPQAWNADQLRSSLLDSRHDLVFLAGHFSASSALAADYSTRLLTSDVLSSPVNLENAIIYSAGCHSGYNIVDAAGIPGVTREPDWAQAFAQKRATLIAGTGYQYGDTDFIKYSERLYLLFTQQLRLGTGPVAIGQALVAAKQAYLAETPALRGIDEKSLLEATLFGLPMLSVDLPAGRTTRPPNPSIVNDSALVTGDPGQTLGLRFADVTIMPTLTLRTKLLNTNSTSQTVTSTYLEGSNGVFVYPVEPVLPLEIRNVTLPATVLRGVGFRGATYSDTPDVLPLTGAATTEVRGVHAPFRSSDFYPYRPWWVNYSDFLTQGISGTTSLVLTPAQFRSDTPTSLTGTLRQFNELDFRLFYSANVSTYGTNTPALAAPPTIVRVLSEVSNVVEGAPPVTVTFQVNVTGDPAAGIQAVWVTYSATNGPLYGRWQSLDLVQNASDSTLWEGQLVLNGTAPEDVRFLVQAVNGVGLVSMVTNLGAYGVPGDNQGTTPPPGQEPTTLQITTSQTSGPYGTDLTVSAVLSRPVEAAEALSGQLLTFSLGEQQRLALTDARGVATATLQLLDLPGPGQLVVAFAGTPADAAASAVQAFTTTQQSTMLTLNAPVTQTQYSDDAGLIATLQDAANRRLREKTVVMNANGANGSVGVPVITDYIGRAPFGPVSLPAGAYSLTVYYLGSIPLPGGGTLDLTDSRYTPSIVTGTLNVLAEDALVTYTGSTSITVGSPLTVSALLTPSMDGTPGDITLAQVQFDLLASNVVVSSTVAPVNAGGTAAAVLNGVPRGEYQVSARAVGGYYTSPPSAAQTVLIFPLVDPLASLTANQVTNRIRIQWETTTEIHNTGFNLYRATAPGGPQQRLNSLLIPSQDPGSSQGYTYTWLDFDVTNGTTYYYWVDQIDDYGTATRTGPVSVTYQAPTALHLQDLQAASGPGLPSDNLLLAGLCLVLTSMIVLRRRHLR